MPRSMSRDELVTHVKQHLGESTEWDHLRDVDVRALVGLTVHALHDAGAIATPDAIEAMMQARATEVARSITESYRIERDMLIAHLTRVTAERDELAASLAEGLIEVAGAAHANVTERTEHVDAMPDLDQRIDEFRAEVERQTFNGQMRLLGDEVRELWAAIQAECANVAERIMRWLDARSS